MAANSVQAGCIPNVSCGIWTVASACFSPPGNKKVAPPFSVLAFFGSRCCGVSNKQHVWKNGITSRFESYRIVSDQTDFSNRTTVCIPRNFVCNCLGVVFVLFCFTIWWSYKTSSKRNWLQFSGCNDARCLTTSLESQELCDVATVCVQSMCDTWCLGHLADRYASLATWFQT